MPMLEDKTIVITGGAGSIGLAAARAFLREGARLLLVDRDEKALVSALACLDAPAGMADYAVADVCDPAAARAYCERAVDLFGPIDVLFSNAGIAGPIAPIADYPLAAFDAVFAVHVRGAFLACKYGLPLMADGGSVIITSSVAAFRSDSGVYAYIPAKAAQLALVRCVAAEAAARGIRVNALVPGPTDNEFQAEVERSLGAIMQRDATRYLDEQIPLGRHARPDEIAEAAMFLASDRSSFTTGSVLRVDGGLTP